MPTRSLPDDPSFEHLRKQAKRLRDGVRTGDAEALAVVREFHPRAGEILPQISLVDAQFAVARAYGFASWTKLKQHLAAIGPFVWNPSDQPDSAPLEEVFIRLACLTYGTWYRSYAARAQQLLDERPDLAQASLSAAAAAGDSGTVCSMLERDPSLVNAKGGPLRWEPLLYACASRLADVPNVRSTLEVARVLLERGADPNAGFLWGATYPYTALTCTFGRGEDNVNQLAHPRDLELARLLLDAGADPNDSQTLYNKHFEENDDHLTLLLAYGLGRDTNGPWQRRLGERSTSPKSWLVQELCWAAMHNFPARVRLLVEHGAVVDINGQSPRTGRTAYEEALRAGHRHIASYLLEKGARKTELDPVETFALACIAGDRATVGSRLAEDPTLLERLGTHGRVELLHRAAAANSPEGVRLIVGLGVDVNGLIPGTGLDRTALHNTAGWGRLEMVQLLIGLGADPTLRDPTYNGAAIGWAAYGQQHQIVEYLLQFASIFDAVRCDGVERVRSLLDADPSLARATDEDGDPVAFSLNPEAAHLDEMIGLLKERGVDINARDKKGRTLLDRALGHRVTGFAELLRRHGATTSD
jgi:ankyrin repeat protein